MRVFRLIIVIMVIIIPVLTGCDDGSSFDGYNVPDVEIQLPKVTCDDIDASGGYHVTVNGSPQGDGSLENPWDLNTGLRHPSVVEPGDTIWIHGGRYEGAWVAKLDGIPDFPVIVSSWPGDRVTLDSMGSSDPVLQIYHEWIVFRGLELTNSNLDRRNSRGTGIWVGGDHISLQNLIVHEVGSGISGGQLSGGVQQGTYVELHGCMFYNNGWLGIDRGHGHHIYLTNRDSKMVLEDNLIFSAYGTGVHAYSETNLNYVQGFDFIGNVWFLNGAPGQKMVDGFLAGHNDTNPVDAILLRENMGWAMDLNGRDVRVGWSSPHNGDVTLESNYIVGKTIFQTEWNSIDLENNVIIGDLEGVSAEDYPQNAYFPSKPLENKIFIRANRYQPGRAHIIIYNWEDLDDVAVNLEAIMPQGTSYVIRNAMDYYGSPIVEGTYGGGDISLPMDGLNEVAPLGESNEIPEKTGREFNLFVVEADLCGLL
jgi:hypothetical protein